MSMEVFERLLEEMDIKIGRKIREDLYRSVIREFTIIGASECEDLERMLGDPYDRMAIEDYIRFALGYMKKVDEEEKRKEKMEIHV
ncbi:MAG: hypothetical protein QMC85_00255 [Methanocellales archaeon]|nr:hypothetical protein [Methanocellales archaeon]